MKSAPAIAFDYRPSLRLMAAVAGVTVLALIALAFSGLPTWLRLLVGLAACGHTAWSWLKFWRTPVRRVAWHAAGHWRVADVDGGEFVAELQHAVARGDWIVLTLRKSAGGRVPLVLAPDNCDAETRRLLRVRLARAGASPASA